MKIYFIQALILFLLLYTIFYIGQKLLSRRIEIDRDLEILMSQSVDLSKKIYNENQLQGLPAPVKSYFEYALKNDQHYISSVYLKHNGQFKTALNKNWINIEGEQHFSIEDPGFIWYGKTALFSVRDMYISGKGRIIVNVLIFFKILDGQGPKYDQGELLRWLGESVWFPTNLLPSSRINWTEINESEANLRFRYKDQVLDYKVSFNPKGEISQFETLRFMGEESLERWIGRVYEYREINGMKIPMKIEAIWKLSDGEHSYAKFNIKEIHHN